MLQEELVEFKPVWAMREHGPYHIEDVQVVHHDDEGVDPLRGVCDHDPNVGDENSGA